MFRKRFMGVILGLVLVLVLAACGDSNDNGDASYSEQVNYAITGIESGAGVMDASENALVEYELDGWEVKASSSGAMATALGEAIDKEEPIIVTGWTPHWKFAEYDLKYLEDPKGVFGGEETINTIVRHGFEEDVPNAYEILDNFNWTTSDMEEIMLEIADDVPEEEAAANWIEKNTDKVATWTDGVAEGNGEDVNLVYVTWDSEIASTNVIAQVLETHGFNVEITPLDNAIMWQAVATGEADAMVAAWVPLTHGELYEEHKDDIVDLGPNLEGAKIGLVVPTYMDIDSIEDLEAK